MVDQGANRLRTKKINKAEELFVLFWTGMALDEEIGRETRIPDCTATEFCRVDRADDSKVRDEARERCDDGNQRMTTPVSQGKKPKVRKFRRPLGIDDQMQRHFIRH